MGTRGKFGFFYKGKYYMAYNRWDSYPSGLGVDLLIEIIHADLDEWIKLLENIKEVDDDEIKPTPEEMKKLEGYTDMSGGGSFTSWHNILKLTQGSFYHTLHSGYLVNVHYYGVDEEFIYVLDLDNKQFRAKAVRGEYEDDDEDDNGSDEEDDDRNNNLDVTIGLGKEELVQLAIKWSKGDLPEDYDPEGELARKQEKAKNDFERSRKHLLLLD